jgi:glycerol-3-phosphate dehydrogenase (NAD(P)+)
VALWAREAEVAAAIAQGENPRYLPGIRFEAGIAAGTDPAAACQADAVLLVTPA